MYEGLAGFYDTYTDDMNREKSADFLMKCFIKYGNRGLSDAAKGIPSAGKADGTDISASRLVLDVGCGTGKFTCLLAQKGFDMTGLDISPEMLEIAGENAGEQNVSVLWLCQDMAKINTYGSYAAVVSTFDSVNHLTTIKKLRSFLTRVINFVDPGGLLIFDFLTPEYFETKIDGKINVDDKETGTCIWQGTYSKNTEICTYSVTCYSQNEEGTYDRIDDIVREKAWSVKTIREELKSAGFRVKNVTGGRRCFVVAEKPF